MRSNEVTYPNHYSHREGPVEEACFFELSLQTKVWATESAPNYPIEGSTGFSLCLFQHDSSGGAPVADLVLVPADFSMKKQAGAGAAKVTHPLYDLSSGNLLYDKKESVNLMPDGTMHVADSCQSSATAAK